MSRKPSPQRKKSRDVISTIAGAASPSAGRWQAWLICGLLLLAVGLVFGQTVRHDFFNMDDDIYVYRNPHLTEASGWQAVGWAFRHGYMCSWHPVTWISLIVDHQLYGLKAGGYHLTNVLLHAATAVALFLVLRRMTGSVWLCGLATAFFALHPLRVESVAWVIERKDVLSGLFFMLTIGAYVGYATRPFSLGRYLVVAAVYALGLMAKPMLVTLPFVLLLLDYWPLGRIGNGRDSLGKLVVEKIPLLALAAGCCAVTIAVQEFQVTTDSQFSWVVRLQNTLVWYVFYLRQFVWPVDLAVLYPPIGELPLWKPIAALLFLVSMTVAAIVWRRHCPYFLVGWLWFLGMMVPVIGLVPFGNETVADRFTYLPQIGLCITVVWGAAALAGRIPRGRPFMATVGLLIVAVLMGCAWRQTQYWRTSETLWTHTLACTTGNSSAHNAFGNALVDAGKTSEAIAQYREAIKVRPNNAAAHFNLGVALASTGAIGEALDEYRTAIAVRPTDATAHNNLGNLLLQAGRFDDALRHCREAVRLAPEFAEAHYNLGNVLLMLVHHRAAEAEYRRAIAIRPGYAVAHYHLGLLLANSGRFEEAVVEQRWAIAAEPKLAEAQHALGLAWKALGRREEAVQAFREAVTIRPDFIEARINLDELTGGR